MNILNCVKLRYTGLIVVSWLSGWSLAQATFVNTGSNVTANAGSSGSVTSGTYNTTTDKGYGWYATGSGAINGWNSTIITSGSEAAALYALGKGSVISGSNLQIQTSGSNGYGIWSNTGGNIHLADSSITTSGRGGSAIYATGSSNINATNLEILTTGSSANGVVVTSGGTVSLTNSTVNAGGVGLYVDGGIPGYGNYSSNGATLIAANVTVIAGRDNPASNGSLAEGLLAQNGGTLIITSSTVTVSGSSAHGIRSLFTDALVSGTNLTLSTSGYGAYGGYIAGISDRTSGTIALQHSSISTSGNSAHGMFISGSGGLFTGHDVSISTTGAGSDGLYFWRGGTAELTDSTISSARGNGIRIYYNDDVTDRATVKLSGGSLLAPQGDLVRVFAVSSSTSFTHADITLDSVITANGANVLRVYGAGSGVPIDVDVNFTAKNSAIKGAIVVDQGAVVKVALTDNALWSVTGNSNMTSLLNQNSLVRFDGGNSGFYTVTVDSYTSNGGGLALNTKLGDDNSETDKLIVRDSVSGKTTLVIHNAGGAGGQTVNGIQVVEVAANNLAGNEFELGNKVGAGMYNYGLDVRGDGAYLVSNRNEISEGGGVVLNTAAAVSGFWFTQLDNLNKRMGELRFNTPSKGNVIENIWIRSYGQQANMKLGINEVGSFSETQYGVDIGTDHVWTLDEYNQLYTGVFVVYGGADRDFRNSYDGSTDSGYGGVYATWLNKDGWYADFVAKGQYFNNSFDGDDSASYDSIGAGVSLELGRQFEFKDGWFAEPSIQVNYVRLMNDDYRTSNGMAVELDDADVVQFYGGARFGRNIRLNQSGWLQPYVKVGGLEQVSSGGKVRADDGQWRPNVDGARAVLGAGIAWQIDEANQLHLDYEASFGDKYDKPWGVNLGFRHKF